MWLWIGRLLTETLVRAVTAATGARKGEVEADGAVVPYLDMGRGEPPLLLVHGFGGDKESWLPLALCLRRRH